MDAAFPLSQALQYLTAKEALLKVSLVSRLCHHLATCEGLWNFFMERDMQANSTDTSQSPQRLYHEEIGKRRTLRLLNTEKNCIGFFYYPSQCSIDWKPLNSTLRLPYDPVLYRLRSGVILLVGGERYLRPAPDVYEVGESSLTVSALASMTVPRASAGVIECSNAVFVFGGMNRTTPIAQCEVWENRAWGTLPDMIEAKADIYPLLHKEKVYICGVKSRIVELFDPAKRAFSLVIQLDNVFSHFSFISNSDLIFMDSFGKYTYYDPATATVTVRSNKETRAERPLGTELAVFEDAVVYCSVERGVLCVYRLRLATLEIEKLFTEMWAGS